MNIAVAVDDKNVVLVEVIMKQTFSVLNFVVPQHRRLNEVAGSLSWRVGQVPVPRKINNGK